MVDVKNYNGRRVYISGDPNVWLVFHERRHRIASPEVYISLFSDTTALVEYSELLKLDEGYELTVGTCLVKADSADDRFLVVKTSEGVRRLHIASWETWNWFAFSEKALRVVPDLVLANIIAGDPIRI